MLAQTDRGSRCSTFITSKLPLSHFILVKETDLTAHANSVGRDQTVHSRSLIGDSAVRHVLIIEINSSNNRKTSKVYAYAVRLLQK